MKYNVKPIKGNDAKKRPEIKPDTGFKKALLKGLAEVGILTNTNKTMTKKYTISPHTLFNEDENLYFTKMGVEGKNMPLHYTVWGKTETESRTRAEQLGEILTAHFKTENISK